MVLREGVRPGYSKFAPRARTARSQSPGSSQETQAASAAPAQCAATAAGPDASHLEHLQPPRLLSLSPSPGGGRERRLRAGFLASPPGRRKAAACPPAVEVADGRTRCPGAPGPQILVDQLGRTLSVGPLPPGSKLEPPGQTEGSRREPRFSNLSVLLALVLWAVARGTSNDSDLQAPERSA